MNPANPQYDVEDYKEADLGALPFVVRSTAEFLKEEFLSESEGRERELWWDVHDRLDTIIMAANQPDPSPNASPKNRLGAAFIWDESPEGWNYWARVDGALDGTRPITDAYEE